jgi:hypothetical protein
MIPKREFPGKVTTRVSANQGFLDSQKARGEAVKPWAFLADNSLSHDMVRVFNAARTYYQENLGGASGG